jgi:TatD DNase family protein
MLVDTHCHLDFPEFEQDLEGIVVRAQRAGVQQMITISTYAEKFSRYAALAVRFESVFFMGLLIKNY